ncbi:hypothetical protein SUT503_00460 [Streptococcus parasuis]|nr:hypothetical protein SUT503_00460 [Streptococcus parasuis]
MSIETYKSIDKIDYQDLENKDLVECCGMDDHFSIFYKTEITASHTKEKSLLNYNFITE